MHIQLPPLCGTLFTVSSASFSQHKRSSGNLCLQSPICRFRYYRRLSVSAAAFHLLRPPSGRFPTALRPLSGRFPAASRPLPGCFPAASRPLPGRSPAASCFLTSHVHWNAENEAGTRSRIDKQVVLSHVSTFDSLCLSLPFRRSSLVLD